MYDVYSNCLYFLSIFLFTYNKNLLSQKVHHVHMMLTVTVADMFWGDCPD